MFHYEFDYYLNIIGCKENEIDVFRCQKVWANRVGVRNAYFIFHTFFWHVRLEFVTVGKPKPFGPKVIVYKNNVFLF